MDNNLNKTNHDVLWQARNLLSKPSKNTKRKILIAINLTFVFITILHLTVQLIQFGKLPDPVRDMIFYPIILLVNILSAFYNIKVIKSEKNGTRFLNNFTAWGSIIILQLMALAIVHTNPNTAMSINLDFALSAILIFISGTVLNKKVAVVWFIVAVISLYIGFQNRGEDFTYHFLTKEEATQFEQDLKQESPKALARFEQLKKEKIEPFSIKLYVSVWFIFLLLTVLPTYIEAGMIGNVLKVIPTVIRDINIAANEKNKLENENIRMGMELDVAKRIQTMVLPDVNEIDKCKDLEIWAIMETATEVGGDFYEVLPQEDGSTYLCIGDVTDHGLQSGVVMLMTQAVVRTSIDRKKVNLKEALNHINKVLYHNIHNRMNDRRNLTLSILKYYNNEVEITGQHENVLIIRKGAKKIEKINTLDLGMYIGLLDDISPFVNTNKFELNQGDIMLLYTDGITEAENAIKEFYGNERLYNSFLAHKELSSKKLAENILKDVHKFIGNAELLDDISMVVVKRV